MGLCHHTEPLYNQVVEPMSYADKALIVKWVHGGHGRPHKASRDALARVSEKHYYIGRFSSTIVVSLNEEKDLHVHRPHPTPALKELGLTEGRNTGYPTAFAALRENGSPELKFGMDDGRSFLSVIIPVHPHFLPSGNDKRQAYEQRVLNALGDDDLTLTELAHAMGYKGISKKLSETVERMVDSGSFARVAGDDGRPVKLVAR